jgi:hypothetical protein
LLRTFATAVFGAGVILAAVPAYADGMNNADCGNCHAAVQSLNVDASSYKLWPSGSKTLLDDFWLPGASTASFSLVNGGTAAIPATNVTIVVENHDPLTQVPVNAMSYTYGVPGLAPQTTATITVPLDYNQCDIFLTLDVGNGVPTVFRTGNPAAC